MSSHIIWHSPPFPPELYEGVTLDGYRVTRELHASSTSQLYLAVDTDTDEKVVLKTPSVNFEDDPAYLERFQMEEWIGRRIDSPPCYSHNRTNSTTSFYVLCNGIY